MGVLCVEPVMTVSTHGTKQWVANDQFHRTDGPAVEYTDGSRQWFVHGRLHRTDGPAIERSDGLREWWVNDQRHRTDGPAVEREDGTRQWWASGVYIAGDTHLLEGLDTVTLRSVLTLYKPGDDLRALIDSVTAAQG